MKSAVKGLLLAGVLLALSLPGFSQGRPGSSSTSSGDGNRGMASPGSSISVSPGASSGSVSSRGFTSSRDFGGFSSISTGSDSARNHINRVFGPPPQQMQYTSFYSLNNYYQWMDFYYFLRSQYFILSPSYFYRFTRNCEPLLTPSLLKLSTLNPLEYSAQMLLAVDELESMLTGLQSGQQVNKEDIILKVKEVRELAKKIRSDQALSFVDQVVHKDNKDILKNSDVKEKGLEAVGQLREMVVDLHAQLKNMYDQNSTSTVSVSTLSQPSLESLSKGIEKLSKVIESSAKRI